MEHNIIHSLMERRTEKGGGGGGVGEGEEKRSAMS